MGLLQSPTLNAAYSQPGMDTVFITYVNSVTSFHITHTHTHIHTHTHTHARAWSYLRIRLILESPFLIGSKFQCSKVRIWIWAERERERERGSWGLYFARSECPFPPHFSLLTYEERTAAVAAAAAATHTYVRTRVYRPAEATKRGRAHGLDHS